MDKRNKISWIIKPWIKSDLPDDDCNSTVLLLGVTRLPTSPVPPRRLPCSFSINKHTSITTTITNARPPSIHDDAYDDRTRRIQPQPLKSSIYVKTSAKKATHSKLRPQNLEKVCPNIDIHPCSTPIPFSTVLLHSDSEHVPLANSFVDCQEVSEYRNSALKQASVSDDVRQACDRTISSTVKYDSVLNDELTNTGTIKDSNYPVGEHEVLASRSCNIVGVGGFSTVIEESTMDRSVDSIGACSLDVDASTVDLSMTDRSENISVGTLRSVSILTTPPPPSTDHNHHLTPPPLQHIANSTTNPKIPSYLSLACTVNGYSTITNYDSHRLGRSRDPSPHRLHPIVTTATNDQCHDNLYPFPVNSSSIPKKVISSSETVRHMPAITTQDKMNQQHTFYSSATTTTNYSKESNSFVKSMIENDQKVNSGVSNGGFRMKTIYDCVDTTDSSVVDGCSVGFNRLSTSSTITNNVVDHESKSFIQQRVERLYGPGALAQGFFVSKRKQNRSFNSSVERSFEQDESEHSKSFSVVHDIKQQLSPSPMKQSASSPALPVLRHLRPEFRAQLPILSPRKTINNSNVTPLPVTTEYDISNTNNVMPKSITVPVLKVADIEFSEGKENSVQALNRSNLNGCNGGVKELFTHVIPNLKNGDDTENGHGEKIINNGDISSKICVTDTNVVKDGHYFIRVLEKQSERLLALAVTAEVILESEEETLSEDAKGFLRSASGKARLLVGQKMQQFKGLCTNNLNQAAGEAFPTTNEDLQGFWDMVLLQVDQIDKLFKQMEKLKANNWQEESIQENPETKASNGTSRKVIPRQVVKVSSAATEEARKQRELQRKNIIEQRRKEMREKKQSDKKNIEIFLSNNR